MNASEVEDVPKLAREAYERMEAGEPLSGFDHVQICAHYGTHELGGYVWVGDENAYHPEDECTFCEGCHGYHLGVDLAMVELRATRTVPTQWGWSRQQPYEMAVCEDYAREHGFYCDRSEHWYHDSHFRQVEVGCEAVCLQEYEDELYYWERDDSYHWEPEPEGAIADYHCNPKRDEPWRNVPNIVALNQYGFGVELETYCPHPEDTAEECPEFIFAERDGSLDDKHGVEFIGHPMTFAEYRDGFQWKPFLEHCRDLDVSSFDNPDSPGGYGMHVSVGREGLSEEHQAKFILLINCNKGMSEAVAGRRENGWARYGKADIETAMEAARDKWGECNHGTATNVEKHRIEVRIFRGTVAWSGFMRNIEYVQAALEYTRDASLRACTSHGGFCRYVKRNSARFPNLLAKLQQRGFVPKLVRDAKGRFAGTDQSVAVDSGDNEHALAA